MDDLSWHADVAIHYRARAVCYMHRKPMTDSARRQRFRPPRRPTPCPLPHESLVKRESAPASGWPTSRTHHRHQRRSHPGPSHRDLRTDLHIYKWDAWAQKTSRSPWSSATNSSREIVDVGSNVKDFNPGQIVSGEGHVVCGRVATVLAAAGILLRTRRGLGSTVRGFAEYLALPMTNVWVHSPGLTRTWRPSSILLGTRCTPRCRFRCLGGGRAGDGAGPIGIMARGAGHAGARYVVITDVNPYRLELARRMKVTRAVDPRVTSLREVQKELGMQEGFDVGLEIRATRRPFARCWPTWPRREGCPARYSRRRDGHRLEHGYLFDADHQRIYGREMYETWVQDDRDAAERAGHSTGHHPPVPLHGFPERI